MLKSDEEGAQISPSIYALLVVDCSRSTASTEISGDSGSRFLTPLLQKNYLPSIPFNKT
jgi:hypothetical protein